MTPIEDLSIVLAHQAPAGTLLLSNRDSASTPPQLILDFTPPQGQATKWALKLDASMQAVQVQAGQHPSIAVAEWRLEVDIASATSPFNSTPSLGEACLYGGQPGFLCKVGYGEGIALTAGGVVPDVSWPDYTGFAKWRIVRLIEGCCDPIVLVERPIPRTN